MSPHAETFEPGTPSEHVSSDTGSPSAPAPRPWFRRPIVLAFGVVAALALLIFGVRYVRYARAYELPEVDNSKAR